MKMDEVCNKNDENYTPEYAIRPLIEFLKPKSKVWCPFDTEDSYFVKILRQEGFKVIYTHISKGGDFFIMKDTDIDCDYIISNPPYSKKTEVLKALFKIGKPFAMLLGVVGLFESQKRFEMFRDNDFEILYFNRRVSFFESFEDEKPRLNPPFSSVYICKGILPKQILFKEINKNQV